jgi:hypothetical protein
METVSHFNKFNTHCGVRQENQKLALVRATVIRHFSRHEQWTARHRAFVIDTFSRQNELAVIHICTMTMLLKLK